MGNGQTRPYYDPQKNGGRLRGKAAAYRSVTPTLYPHTIGGQKGEVAVLEKMLSDASLTQGSTTLSVGLSLSPTIFQTADTYNDAEAVALATKALQFHKDTGKVFRVRRLDTHRWSRISDPETDEANVLANAQ